jgi:hypothetical protein
MDVTSMMWKTDAKYDVTRVLKQCHPEDGESRPRDPTKASPTTAAEKKNDAASGG